MHPVNNCVNPFSSSASSPHFIYATTRRTSVPRSLLALIRPSDRTGLVYTLERRHSLALVLVEGGTDDLAVRKVDTAVGLLLEAQGVLHPVLIVTVGVVLAGVGTTRLLAVGGRDGSLGTIVWSARYLSGRYSRVKTYAQVSRFLSSRVSTRSEFQIMLRSLMPT